MTSGQEFSKYFDKLERLLKERLYRLGEQNTEIPFGELIRKLEEKGDSKVKSHFLELQRLRDIRNLIKHGDPRLTVIPTEECVKRLKEIVSFFEQRIIAFNIATKNVFTATLETKIKDVISQMAERNFSQVPVVDSEKRVIGLITYQSIIEWLNKQIKEGFLGFETQIKDIPFPKDDPRVYRFISRNTPLEKIQEIFTEAYQSQQDPLYALIVTESGKKSDKILGIITAEDAFIRPKNI